MDGAARRWSEEDVACRAVSLRDWLDHVNASAMKVKLY
jgi:hypothetical protein